MKAREGHEICPRWDCKGSGLSWEAQSGPAARFCPVSPLVLEASFPDLGGRPRGGAPGHCEVSAPLSCRPHTRTCVERRGEGER